MDSSASRLVYLVRYGTTPEVARCVVDAGSDLSRGDAVIVRTHRGEQLGTLLERERSSSTVEEIEFEILRRADEADLAQAKISRQRCEQAFGIWMQRIADWDLQIELLDIEETLDGQKTILYVLCERGPDSTKLALQAAAAGLGLIEVQPVSAEGLVVIAPSGGGCGTGGCGCEH
ncbi:MAG: PSP1 C-terminal domain-containing protein [Planctomycetaceae bacterium]|nr:PSP1 C-terminal domain-containing protein [Planctomycetaceae bacterium]